MYWVSFIQKDSKDSEPRLCAFYDSCVSLEEAKSKILQQRKNYYVYSAWIKDGDEKEIVFYECYVDGMGYIKKPTAFKVKFNDFEERYEDRHDYETEEEANEAIKGEIEVLKEYLGSEDFENQYDLEDYGSLVEITPIASTTPVFRWTRMWR